MKLNYMTILKRMYTLDDLKPSLQNPTAHRSQTRILVVDDQPFDKKNPLETLGFNITVKTQWQDIKDAEPYHIIVSDNRGVAGCLNSTSEGAFMLQQIHQHYPFKPCILYSESAIDFSDTRLLTGIKQLKKDDDISEWTALLTEAISELYNYRSLWLMVEDKLNKDNVSRKVLRQLEHQYVRSILKQERTLNIDDYRQLIPSNSINLLVEIFKLVNFLLQQS